MDNSGSYNSHEMKLQNGALTVQIDKVLLSE